MRHTNSYASSAYVALGWFIGTFGYKLLLHPEESLQAKLINSILPALLLFALNWIVLTLMNRRK